MLTSEEMKRNVEGAEEERQREGAGWGWEEEIREVSGSWCVN